MRIMLWIVVGLVVLTALIVALALWSVEANDLGEYPGDDGGDPMTQKEISQINDKIKNQNGRSE